MSGDALRRAKLSREDLFERLRAQGVRQLGEVQRAYFEQDGNLTVFTHEHDAPPGLPVVPPWDLEPPRVLSPGEAVHGPLACLGCGATRDNPEQQDAGALDACACGSERFTRATTDPLAGSGDGADARDGGGRGALAGRR